MYQDFIHEDLEDVVRWENYLEMYFRQRKSGEQMVYRFGSTQSVSVKRF